MMRRTVPNKNRKSTGPPVESYESAIAELSQPGAAKFKTAKMLVQKSEKNPSALYSFFPALRRLLHDENRIIQWTAIRIIANLARIDRENRISRILDEYLAPISGRVMITAANTIAGAALIAQARPRLAPKVIRAILEVEQARYQTAECRNVVLGQAITALESIGARATCDPDVTAFVKRQLGNSRRSTREKAKSFLSGL